MSYHDSTLGSLPPMPTPMWSIQHAVYPYAQRLPLPPIYQAYGWGTMPVGLPFSSGRHIDYVSDGSLGFLPLLVL